jgi:hypothetical protein
MEDPTLGEVHSTRVRMLFHPRHRHLIWVGRELKVIRRTTSLLVALSNRFIKP